MTNIHRDVWPSISLISANNGVAEATPVIVPDELGEEGREGQDREPVHEDHEPPEPHAEVRAPRVARRPNLPTKAEIDDHYPLHLNYRSWCEHCVAGKARIAQHLVEPGDRERLGVTRGELQAALQEAKAKRTKD